MRYILLINAMVAALLYCRTASADDYYDYELEQLQRSMRPVGHVIVKVQAGELSSEEAEKEIAGLAQEDPEQLRRESLYLLSTEVDIVKLYIEARGKAQAVKVAEECVRERMREKEVPAMQDSEFLLTILFRFGGENEKQLVTGLIEDNAVFAGLRFAAARVLARYGSDKLREEVLAFLSSVPCGDRGRLEYYDCCAVRGGLSDEEFYAKHPRKFQVDEGEYYDTETLLEDALCALNTREAQEVLANVLRRHMEYVQLKGIPKRAIFYMAESAPDLLLPRLKELLDPECEEDGGEAVWCHVWAFDILMKYYLDRLPKEWFEKKFAACFYDMDDPESSPRYESLRPGTDTYLWAGKDLEHIAETIRNMKPSSSGEGASASAADDPQPDGDDASAPEPDSAEESAE